MNADEYAEAYRAAHGRRYVWPTELGACVLELPPALTPDEALTVAAEIGALLVMRAAAGGTHEHQSLDGGSECLACLLEEDTAP